MRQRTDYIVIHCSATPPNMKVDVHEIDRWHRQRGWLMVGYHFVITRDGTLQKGREINATGAHCAGFNHKSIGICMVGGVNKEGKPENNFTKEQWIVLELLIKELKGQYTDAFVVGHRELTRGKDCPSFDVGEWMVSIHGA